MAGRLFVLLICIFPSMFHLLEDNFLAFSGPDWYHFSSNDSFYFPRNECREISKKYKNGYCLREPTLPDSDSEAQRQTHFPREFPAPQEDADPGPQTLLSSPSQLSS